MVVAVVESTVTTGESGASTGEEIKIELAIIGVNIYMVSRCSTKIM